jgi:hypothetical protein
MQKLNPLKVPWSVSPSTPFLRLLATESQPETPTQIVFVAYFGLRSERTTRQGLGFECAPQVSDPHQLATQPGNESKTDSLVRIQFKDGLYARMSPAFSDGEVVNPRDFDASLIPYSNPPNDVGVWLRDFQSLWMKSGNCPDPCAYTVESSRWISDLALTGFEHFLVQGHDAYIEVLARDWKWEEINKLPDWW